MDFNWSSGLDITALSPIAMYLYSDNDVYLDVYRLWPTDLKI